MYTWNEERQDCIDSNDLLLAISYMQAWAEQHSRMRTGAKQCAQDAADILLGNAHKYMDACFGDDSYIKPMLQEVLEAEYII